MAVNNEDYRFSDRNLTDFYICLWTNKMYGHKYNVSFYFFCIKLYLSLNYFHGGVMECNMQYC